MLGQGIGQRSDFWPPEVLCHAVRDRLVLFISSLCLLLDQDDGLHYEADDVI